MKKSFNVIVVVALLLVCALLNTILFLTIHDARLETTVFWVAWAFALPWNFVIAIALHLWACGKNKNGIVALPIVYYFIAIFGLIYLALGFVFMYINIPWPVFLVTIEIIVTVVYAIVLLYAIFGASYIMKNEKNTRNKVLFIKLLKTDVDACVENATNAKVRKALSDLSDKVRFSDPMSHESLGAIENQISSIVFEISSKLTDGTEEELLALVKKADAQLDLRNNRCLVLK